MREVQQKRFRLMRFEKLDGFLGHGVGRKLSIRVCVRTRFRLFVVRVTAERLDSKLETLLPWTVRRAPTEITLVMFVDVPLTEETGFVTVGPERFRDCCF